VISVAQVEAVSVPTIPGGTPWNPASRGGPV